MKTCHLHRPVPVEQSTVQRSIQNLHFKNAKRNCQNRSKDGRLTFHSWSRRRQMLMKTKTNIAAPFRDHYNYNTLQSLIILLSLFFYVNRKFVNMILTSQGPPNPPLSMGCMNLIWDICIGELHHLKTLTSDSSQIYVQ